MVEDTGSIGAASILLNLTAYRVITVNGGSAGRPVVVEASRPKWLPFPPCAHYPNLCKTITPGKTHASGRDCQDNGVTQFLKTYR